MKTRPILFSGPMVRALLAGEKTQTRRIIKSQPYSNGYHFDGQEILCHNDYLPPSAMLMDVKFGNYIDTISNLEGWESLCPYGQPGDRLYVRETWNFNKNAIGSAREEDGPFEYAADGHKSQTIDDRWWPSIHMPRYASRIMLEITKVRIEQLHDITDDDAYDEGVQTWAAEVQENGNKFSSIRSAWQALWEGINGVESWKSNPWVWVVEFKRVTPPAPGTEGE